MYFRLRPYTYAAEYADDIVLLDLENDKYFNVTGKGAVNLKRILLTNFVERDKTYVPAQKGARFDIKEINDWVQFFVNEGFIEKSCIENVYCLNTPKRLGGLADYQWDTKAAFVAFKKARKGLIIKAFFMIIRVWYAIKRNGIKGIVHTIEKMHARTVPRVVPTQQERQELADAIDAAAALFPKKIYCLAWAATYVIMALKHGWQCSFVIGVQGMPFYAHAWAEVQDEVINDAPHVREYLSVMLMIPTFDEKNI